MTSVVTDNPAAERYELEIDGQTVFARYRRDGANLAIRHVEAPPALRGSGAASQLMDAIMQIARRDHLTVTPLCSYAAWWLQRHPEYRDLVA
ncbi:MAG: N-acetyltransferase [Proteobacteria bacterium]|nr:N-acetyltransferase [Pseudomonadota bacterium]